APLRSQVPWPHSSPRPIDLVENGAVTEEARLRLLPSAEIVQRHKLQIGKAFPVLRIGRVEVGWAIEVLGCQPLADVGVEELEIGLREYPRTLLIDIAIDQRHRRLGLDGN